MSQMKKDYNYDAQMGGDTTDVELCYRYGISLDVANTPRINEEMRKAIRTENFNDLVKAGYSEGQARSIADKQYAEAAKLEEMFKKS